MKKIITLATFAFLNAQLVFCNIDAILESAERKISNCLESILLDANIHINITGKIDKAHISKHFFHSNDKSERLNMVEYLGQECANTLRSKFASSNDRYFSQKRQELYMMVSICKAIADCDTVKILPLNDDRIGVLLKSSSPFPMTNFSHVDNMLFVLSECSIVTIYCTAKSYNEYHCSDVNTLAPFISISDFITKLTCNEDVKLSIRNIEYENKFLPLSDDSEEDICEPTQQIEPTESEISTESTQPQEHIELKKLENSSNNIKNHKKPQNMSSYVYDCANCVKKYSTSHLIMLYKAMKKSAVDKRRLVANVEAHLKYFDELIYFVANATPKEDEESAYKYLVELALSAVLDLLIVSKNDIAMEDSEGIFIKTLWCSLVNYNKNLLYLSFALYSNILNNLTKYLINYIDAKFLENCSRHCYTLAKAINEEKQSVAQLEQRKNNEDVAVELARKKGMIAANSSILLKNMLSLLNLFKYVKTREVAISPLDNFGVKCGGRFIAKFYFLTKAVVESLNPQVEYLAFFKKNVQNAISIGEKNNKIDRVLVQELNDLMYKKAIHVSKF